MRIVAREFGQLNGISYMQMHESRIVQRSCIPTRFEEPLKKTNGSFNRMRVDREAWGDYYGKEK